MTAAALLLGAAPLARAAPDPPAGLTAAGGAGQISLSWDATLGALSYTVYRADSEAGPFTSFHSDLLLPGDTDTSLPNGKRYCYEVTASDATGESAQSAPACATTDLPTPANVSADGGTPGQVTLSWDPVPDATSYSVRRATTAGGPYDAAVSASGTSFTDSSVSNGTTYYYVVTAVTADAESALSNEVNATTLPVPAPPPVTAPPPTTTTTTPQEQPPPQEPLLPPPPLPATPGPPGQVIGHSLNLSLLQLRPTTFHARRGKGASIARVVGTQVEYVDSEAVTTTFGAMRARPGRLRGARCVSPARVSRRRRKHAKRCTRYAQMPGTFTHADATGWNEFHWSGRLGGRPLAPGTYYLLVSAADASGHSATPIATLFRIAR